MCAHQEVGGGGFELRHELVARLDCQFVLRIAADDRLQAKG